MSVGPVPVSLAYAVGKVIGQLLSSPAPSSDQQQVYNDIGTIVEVLQFLVNVIEGLEAELLNDMNAEGPHIYNTGKAIGQIGYDWSESMVQLIEVIIPASLRWVEGDIDRRLIEPLKGSHNATVVQVNKLTADLSKLTKRVEALEDWKQATVTPALTKLSQFLTAWTSVYAPIVTRVGQWFTTTSSFVAWAAPLLWTTIVDDMAGSPDNAHMVALEKALIAQGPALTDELDTASVAIWDS